MSDKTKIIFKNSFLTILAMVSYFFFLRGVQLDQIPALRIVNFLFIFIGVSYAIKQNIFLNSETKYWENFRVGMYTSLLTVIISLIILIIYINNVQPNFIVILQSSFFFWENQLSLPVIIFILFIQGLIVSVISTFILMNYWKKNT